MSEVVSPGSLSVFSFGWTNEAVQDFPVPKTESLVIPGVVGALAPPLYLLFNVIVFHFFQLIYLFFQPI